MQEYDLVVEGKRFNTLHINHIKLPCLRWGEREVKWRCKRLTKPGRGRIFFEIVHKLWKWNHSNY